MSAMGRIRVLIVDDSAFTRQTLKKMLESDPEVEVIGIASDGLDAMSKALRLSPDLITLDFEMPEMDGFTFLRWLMRERPTPVIMVSSYVEKSIAFKALELGALDFVTKPTRRASLELENIERDLLAKVKAIRDLNINALSKTMLTTENRETCKGRKQSDIDILAIGSSTGGPTALHMILSQMPSDLPCPVVVSQHMPPGFTGSLADRINKSSRLNIKEAEEGDTLLPGHAYICPGGNHMTLRHAGPDVKIELHKSRPDDKYTPSVDRMVLSVVEHYGAKSIGVILTGMGNDGRDGMVKLKEAGGYTIAESEETAVVYGMPREVIEAGAAKKALPLDKIPSEIIRVALGERRGSS